MDDKVRAVFDILEVEPDEEFKYINLDRRYKITKDLEVQWLVSDDNWEKSVIDLAHILKHSHNIEKVRFIPKNDEHYYFVSCGGNIDYGGYKSQGRGIRCSHLHFRLGNCYRTEKEASQHLEKWERFYNSNEIIDWE